MARTDNPTTPEAEYAALVLAQTPLRAWKTSPPAAPSMKLSLSELSNA